MHMSRKCGRYLLEEPPKTRHFKGSKRKTFEALKRPLKSLKKASKKPQKSLKKPKKAHF
jgi:hypothetical protein